MDKSKNRTDLLAAGRKKLQQFRNKKDNKGSHAKSSAKDSKPDKDGDADEPSRILQAHPTEPVDILVLPSESVGDDHKGPEEVPTVSSGNEEATGSGSEHCNGEGFEGDADARSFDAAKEDVASVPSSLLEMVREVDGSSFPFESSHEGAVGPPVSGEAENARGGGQILLEDGCLERGEMDIKITTGTQEANRSPIADDELYNAGADFTDRPEGGPHLEENQGVTSFSQDYSSSRGEDGGSTPGEEERTNGETSAPLTEYVRAQEEIGSSCLAEELREVDPHFSKKTEENTSLVESLAVPSSNCDFPIAGGEKRFVAADEEDEQIHDEKGSQQDLGTLGANGSLVPGIIRQDLGDLSSKPRESTFPEDATVIVSSMSKDIPTSEGGDGAVVAVEDRRSRKFDESLFRFGRNQVANKSSILGELLQEANTNFSDNPEESTYSKENLEGLGCPSEDIPADKREVGSVRVDKEEPRRTNEGGLLQLSFGADATIESEYRKEFPEKWPIINREKTEVNNQEISQVGNSDGELKGVTELLYITMVEKDTSQLQLAEQIKLNTEYQQHSSYETSKFQALVKDTQRSKAMVNDELEQYRSQLEDMATAKKELEMICLSMKGEIQELHTSASELQGELECSQEEMSLVLIELAGCKSSLEAIQKENLELKATLDSKIDERKKLMEENEFYSRENSKLASELLEQKERSVIALNKQTQLQSNLREAMTSFEQLTEENMCLSSSLDIHKEMIRDLYGRQLESLSQASEVVTGKKMSLVKKDDVEDSGSSVILVALKQHLEEANNILQNLENSVEGMHSHSMSLNGSSGRSAAPGISKIIQAFESKAHHEENVSDEVPLIEGGHSEDSFNLTKEQTCSLKAILKQMELDMGKAGTRSMEEQNDITFPKPSVVECDSQNQENGNQENAIFPERIKELVEQMSDYGSKIFDLQNHIDDMQQSAEDAVARLSSQVEMLQKEVYESVSAVKQEQDSIRGAIVEGIEKLNASTGLQVNDNSDLISHILASVDATVLEIDSLHGKVEAAHRNYNIQKKSHEEVNNFLLDMQGRFELATAELMKIYCILKEIVDDSYLVAGEALLDVNAGEALEVLPGNCLLLIQHLKALLDERLHLLSKNDELESGLLNRNQEIEELNMRYNGLVKKLEDECHSKERLALVLMNRSTSFEELNSGVLTLVKKLENHILSKDLDADSESVEFDNIDNDSNISSLVRIDQLIACHLQKYNEAVEQINLSKSYLREVDIVTKMSADNWSLPLATLLRQEFVPKVTELQENLKLVCASNLQLETEIQTLKEQLSKLEETLEASHSELNLKASELEQFEQRLPSVREKLSIAVAKGKGLIVQRDSLKQSLAEKSNELEKCMQELQSKEALLHEIEAKLKSCSEVDRVEALESELSYIRDSATALRDSFLLKDSVLQRIEEVLEDLDLPEHFDSKDIVEKIELLSRLAVSNPSLTDWDHKSLKGPSHSDAGFGAIDAWKDDRQPSTSQEFEELKRKYEDLQRKFYGLAEHNDMLEQSLTEKYNLVQKWEDLLEGIDILPHIGTLEPEDRIECLGRALFEIQQERDSLQHRIENLEVSSDMLIVDVEESHRKISELSAEVVAVRSQKEFFSVSLDELRLEYLENSEKAAHEEFVRENLQGEVTKLQERLFEINRAHNDTEIHVHKLLDLVTSALPDSDKFEVLSGGSGFESLERLLSKLIENYTTLSSDKSMCKVIDKEVLLEESNLSLDKQTSEDVEDDKEQELVALRSELDESSRSLRFELDDKEQELVSMRSERGDIEQELVSLRSGLDNKEQESFSLRSELDDKEQELVLLRSVLGDKEQELVSLRSDLDESSCNLSLVKQERDAAMEKCHALTLEIEEMTSQINIWQEQRTNDMEKYQALVLELQATGKKRDALQDQLNQEEQKSAATKEKLNIAVRKGKGLVQQRDSLKQALEEMNSKVEHLKIEHNQQVEALKSEKSLLFNQLAVTENNFQETNQKLSRLLTAVDAIYVSSEVDIIDPVQKLKEISELNHDLHSSVVSSEHEAKKSKRAAELLIVELNEVQERADILQDELAKAEAALIESSKQKEDANAAKVDALSRLEHIMQVHSDERRKQISNMVELKSGIDQLRKCCFGFSSLLSNTLRKDMVLFSHVESFLKEIDVGNGSDLSFPGYSNVLSNNPTTEENSHARDGIQESEIHLHLNDSSITEQLVHACYSLHECVRQYDYLKGSIQEHSSSIDQEAKCIFETLEIVKGTLHSQKEVSESLKRDVAGLELMIKRKETEISVMHGNVSLLYEACSKSIAEFDNRKCLPNDADRKDHVDEHTSVYTDDSVKMIADSLISTVKDSRNINEMADGNQRQLKETILNFQEELQEKDSEMKRICEELVSQIREAESLAKRYLTELDSSRTQLFSLEQKVAALENDKKLLESRVSELENCEASSKDLQERFKSLTDAVAAKDQEIEALMQALDEEESQMESLETRNKELEDVMQGKMVALENLEASRAKTLAKLATTVSKFDELHNLSESLLAEIESLQSKLQSRDSEISFLRQEVTRCTNDVLASQETNKKYLSEMHEVLRLMENMVIHFGEPHVQPNDQNWGQIHSYIDIVDKKIVAVMDEIEDLRVTVQSKDSLLQVERGKVEELLCKTKELETLYSKETQREQYQGEGDSGQASSMKTPGISEIEQMVQRTKASSGPVVTHIRSGRKANNEQVAIAIDMEKDDNILDDEDDDKSHGFRSLIMSRLIPRATRPIADRIDGIWVSGERLLMRQPSLRLGVIMYWIILHALLASFI